MRRRGQTSVDVLRVIASVVVAQVSIVITLAQTPAAAVAFVKISSPQQRLRYLATARIWADPPDVTPEAILAGQPLPDATDLEDALRGQPFVCRFAKPGKALGGNTPKFACLMPGGREVRIKYNDGSPDGNREIFSAVAAARLLWALGFDSDPIYPITVDCLDCPENPMSGTGPSGRRSYLATLQPRFQELTMVDGTNPNEGWRWGELDQAIAGLPEGPLRERQRMHFDALTLLGVLLQHGDRKPEQQRLGCRGNLDTSAGDVRDSESHSVPVFFERRDAIACRNPVIAIQDVGATFGGAGRLSSSTTATMNLRSWGARPIFRPAQHAPAGVVPECRGFLTISLAAGEGGEANPHIGEAGRRFLLERLQQLSDAHLQALFATARIDKLPETQRWQDPRSGTAYSGLDAWVAVFKDKVRQIEERRCAP